MFEGEGECAICMELILENVYMCTGCSMNIICQPCKLTLQKKQNQRCASCRQTPIDKFIRNRLAEHRNSRIEKERAHYLEQSKEIEML